MRLATLIPGFAKELFRAQDALIPKLSTLTAPFWLGHGTSDTIVPLRSSTLVWSKVGTPEGSRVFKKYDGLRHEIMNEPTREEVIQDIISWC
jgi:alpha-beta hydrolase superfamily lysophospholipase